MHRHDHENPGQINRTTMTMMGKRITNRSGSGIERADESLGLFTGLAGGHHADVAALTATPQHQCAILLVGLANITQINDDSTVSSGQQLIGKIMGIERQQDRPPSPARSDGWSHGVPSILEFSTRSTRRENWRSRALAGVSSTRLPPESSSQFLVPAKISGVL
jgi:hypothetical protein